MKENSKQQLLEQVKQHLVHIRERIQQTVVEKENQTGRLKKDNRHLSPGDMIAQYAIVAHQQEHLENLKQLYPSPYFAKCEFETESEKKTMYFGKFSFSEEGVYSWVTPAAALRFENPGSASYTRPDGSRRSGIMHSKDQYMIVDGKLLFYSTESIGSPRELVYQEHFTQHKQGFVLPEVVEQMEKAQDQIVRAHYHGPFVISGPAGSGKTTLALHRVAYLAQSPETAEFFQPEMVLVLVQDNGTKEYFSHLLPELGIRGVAIRTFAEWAMDILDLDGCSFVQHYGQDDTERFNYESAKLQALRSGLQVPYNKNIYTVLNKIYENYLGREFSKLWKQQRVEKILDRLDLTILLLVYGQTKGEYTVQKEYYQEFANGTYRKKIGKFPVKYNLLVVDEFQNYLPEQLKIVKGCINKRLESVVYVGDLAQQTRLGTVRAWDDIGESVQAERLVVLQKVFRNTKQILQYINSLGYTVEVPKEIKDGAEVVQKIMQNSAEEIEYIKNNMGDNNIITIGILAKNKIYLSDFEKQFGNNKNIFCLSLEESQGVEFDKVFIVGVQKNMFDVQGVSDQIVPQIKKIQKDLLYVALTRAMSELYVLGTCRLEDIVEF